MSKKPNQKLKLIYLMKILLERTDENHSLTLSELSDELGKYDISAERKSLYDDIELLRVYGLDIRVKRDRRWILRGRAHLFSLGTEAYGGRRSVLKIRNAEKELGAYQEDRGAG